MNTFPLSEPLVQRLAWTLIHFVWQGFAIALLLALAVRLGRVQRSDWRYGFSLVALLAMTASPMATFMIVKVPTPLKRPVQHSPAATPQPSIPHSIPDHHKVPPQYGAIASDLVPASVTEPTATPLAAAQAIDSPSDVSRLPLYFSPFTWQQVQPWIVSVWICGVALLSSRLLIGWVGVRQIRRRGITAPGWLVEQTQRLAGDLQMACPQLNLSHRVQEAIALGFLRPMILLPAAWVTQMPPDMLEAVLVHELAHIHRHDLWINLFQRIVETLLFYHPAVWWLSRRLRIERELCCDELVVRVTQNPLRYAETLEHIGRLSLAARSAPLIVSIMGSRSMLSVRIRNILRLKPQQQSPMAWLAGAIPLLLAGSVYWSMAAGPTVSAYQARAIEGSPADGAAANESQLQAGPFGRIEGEIVIDPQARKAGFQPESLKLVFRSIKSMREFARLEDKPERHPTAEGRATVTVDPSGKFSVDSLAAGYLKIESSLTSDSPFALILPTVAQVQPGQTKKLALDITTQATCHGFVRKRGSNEPIVGATVCLEQPARSTLRNRQQRVKTDAAGRYEATLLSGPVKIRLETKVEGFATVHAWESPHFHAGTSLYYEVPGKRITDELPALELVPLEPQAGKLLDQQGEPASEHWEVLGYSAGIWAQFSARAHVQANGEFNIQFPSAYPPQVFGARPIVRGVDTPTHQLIVVSQQPLILKFNGQAWPPTEPRAVDWRRVEIKISEMFPKSKVHLLPIRQQIVVRGQASHPEERSHIIAIVRGEAINAPTVLDDGTQVMMEVTNEVVVPDAEGPKVKFTKGESQGARPLDATLPENKASEKNSDLMLSGETFDPNSSDSDLDSLKAYYRSLGYFDLTHQIDKDKVDRIRDVQLPKDNDPATIAKESEAIASGIDKSQGGTRRLAFTAIDPKVPFNVRTMTARQPYRQRAELSGGVQVSVEESKCKWQMRANQVLVETDSHDKPDTGPQDTEVHLQADKYVLTTRTPLRMTLSGNISVVCATHNNRDSTELIADKIIIDFERGLLFAEKARFKSNETILESDRIALSFRGGSFRVGTVPEEPSQSKTQSVEAIRRLRIANTDKEAASKLMGDWKLILPSGKTHDLKLTQREDGCLRLSRNLNLSGAFAYQNKRLELVEPTQDNVFDFIWALQEDGSFKLIHEQHNVSAKYLGAVLVRAAADSENAATRPMTKIQQLRSARTRANDREAARNLIGRWLLTLPTKDLLDVELTAAEDGCLRLACRKEHDLVGRYSLNGARLELVDHENQDTDFVWQLDGQNTLNLIAERHKAGLAHVGAKLERIAAAVPQANVFQIPNDVLAQTRELAAAATRKNENPKSLRPPGLEDLESPDAIKRAVDRAMLFLADSEKSSDGLIQLRYLGEEALAALIAGAKSENAQVAKWSCSALEHRGLKAVAPLSEALKSSPDSTVRSVAASALGQTFQPTVIPALIAALDDPDPQVRTSVLHSIKYPRDARAITPLRRFVDDPGVGHVAADAIRHIQTPQGYAWWPADKLDLWQLCQDAHTLKGERYRDAELNQLTTGLKSDDGTITYCCLFALGRLRSKESVSAIIKAPLSEMKFHVLAEIATPDAIEYLIQRLHSLNSQTRELAIRGLANGADRWATPLLIALLDDPALKVEARKKEFPGRSSIDAWPESHRAHSALYSLFSRFGLTGEWRNLYANQTNNVPEEITNLKIWWKQHGADFVAGKKVPTPNLSTVFYNDP